MGALATLTELFPQVDVRILRGAVLSHDEDIQAAVEWIMTEVLPELGTVAAEANVETTSPTPSPPVESYARASSLHVLEQAGGDAERLLLGSAGAQPLLDEGALSQLQEASSTEASMIASAGPLKSLPLSTDLSLLPEASFGPVEVLAEVDTRSELMPAEVSGEVTKAASSANSETSGLLQGPENLSVQLEVLGDVAAESEPEDHLEACSYSVDAETSSDIDCMPAIAAAERLGKSGGSDEAIPELFVQASETETPIEMQTSGVADASPESIGTAQRSVLPSVPSGSDLYISNNEPESSSHLIESEEQPEGEDSPEASPLGSPAIVHLHTKKVDDEASGSQYWDVRDALAVNTDDLPDELLEANTKTASTEPQWWLAKDRTAEFLEAVGPRSMEVQTTFENGLASREVDVVLQELGKEEAEGGLVVGSVMDAHDAEAFHGDGYCSSSTSLWESLTCSGHAGLPNVEDLDRLVEAASTAKEEIRHNIKTVEERVEATLRAEAVAMEVEALAEKGGEETMGQVEELRRDMVRARELLETRSGEIFGEKAVLATEARELRARLGQVNAARLAARSTLEAMLGDLDKRFEAALKRQEAAAVARKEKEERAVALLEVEKKELAKLGKQSEELDAEAEACTKLREFLIEQAGAVDAMKGEVDVLCEDVEALKQKLAAASCAAEQLSAAAGVAGEVSDDERSSEPLAVLASMREALGLRLQPSGGAVAPTPKLSSAVGSQRDSPKSGSLASSVHQEETEQSMYIARMAMAGGRAPQTHSYGSQDLAVFRDREDEDFGWQVLDMDAAGRFNPASPGGSGSRGHGSSLSSSNSSNNTDK